MHGTVPWHTTVLLAKGAEKERRSCRYTKAAQMYNIININNLTDMLEVRQQRNYQMGFLLQYNSYS